MDPHLGPGGLRALGPSELSEHRWALNGQIECQEICQIERQIECQKECQKICQIKCQNCLPDRMPEGMPDRMSYRMPEGMPDRYETVPPPPLSTGPGVLLIAARTAAANEKFVSLLLDWGLWDIAVASLQVTSVYIRLPPSN